MDSYKLYGKALGLVGEKLKDVKDLAGQPVLNHIYRVNATVYEGCGNTSVQVIAILHEILEDSDYTKEELLADFGERVFDAVVLLSRDENQDYDDYIKKLSKNRDAVLVKLADLKDNMDITRLKTLSDGNINRLKKYHKAYKYLMNL